MTCPGEWAKDHFSTTLLGFRACLFGRSPASLDLCSWASVCNNHQNWTAANILGRTAIDSVLRMCGQQNKIYIPTIPGWPFLLKCVSSIIIWCLYCYILESGIACVMPGIISERELLLYHLIMQATRSYPFSHTIQRSVIFWRAVILNVVSQEHT